MVDSTVSPNVTDERDFQPVTFQLSLNTDPASAAYPTDLLVISSGATVAEAVQLMQTQRASCLLICDGPSVSSPNEAASKGEHASNVTEDGHEIDASGIDPRINNGMPHVEGKTCTESKDSILLGIYTERDALKWMASGCPADVPITEAMSTVPVTLKETESVGEAIQKMGTGGYRHLPIISSDGAPMSIATVHGMVHYLVEHFPDTIYNLPPVPSSGPSEREGA